MNPARAAAGPPERAACVQCGLPLGGARGRGFCCFGCEIAHAVGGERGRFEAGSPLLRVAAGAFFSMNVMMLALALYGMEREGSEAPAALVGLLRWMSLFLATPAILLLGVPMARCGWAPGSGSRFRAERLIVAAALAAFLLSAWHVVQGDGAMYFESACMVLLFSTLGTYLSARARSGAREQLEHLFEVAATSLSVERDGVALSVTAAELAPGDRVSMVAGDRVPADGVVDQGGAWMDPSQLTGEPLPRWAAAGTDLRAGEVVRQGSLRLRVVRREEHSTLGQLRAALRRALANPPPLARLVDRAAQLLTVVTLLLAATMVVVLGLDGRLEEGLQRALALAVVACPCALGLASPLVTTLALRRAAELGVVVQDLDALEQLGRVDRVLLDKTGTLTSPEEADLTIVPCDGAAAEEVRALVHGMSRASHHPVCRALATARRASSMLPVELADLHEVEGRGMQASEPTGAVLRLGAPRWALGEGEAADPSPVVLTRDGRLLARILLGDPLRPGVRSLVPALRARGLDVEVLSGDQVSRCDDLARGLDVVVRGRQSPEDKLRRIEELRAGGRRVLWIGDGINDALAMAAAHVGMAVDRRVSWLSEGAGLVILGPSIGQLPQLVDLARSAHRRVLGNLVWAAGYNAVALALGCLGVLRPSLAALAMVAGSILVVSRSLRPLAPNQAPEPSTNATGGALSRASVVEGAI